MSTRSIIAVKSVKTTLIIACLFFAWAAASAPCMAGPVKYVLKNATLAPKGIGWTKEWVETLEPGLVAACKGELEFKTYYGGIMGDEEDYIKKMRIGQLDAGAITGQGAVQACPELTAVELPFMFNNYDEVDYVRDRMYPVFDQYAQSHGFKLVYWFEQDFDQCYSTKLKMETLEDFQTAKFVTWYGPIERRFLESVGAGPIPINGPEVPSALRQGIVDTVIAPAVWVVGSQTYTLFTSVNTLKLRYAPGILVFTLDAWNRFPKEYKDNIEATRGSSLRKFISATRLANTQSLEAILKYGVKEAQMPQAVKDRIRDMALATWDQAADEDFPAEVLDQIKEHLAGYRASAQ